VLEPVDVVDDVAAGGEYSARLPCPGRARREGVVGVPDDPARSAEAPMSCSANHLPAIRLPSQNSLTRGSSSTLLSQAEPESPASIGSQIANTFNFAFG